MRAVPETGCTAGDVWLATGRWPIPFAASGSKRSAPRFTAKTIASKMDAYSASKGRAEDLLACYRLKAAL
jgi:hypothetical protein